MYFSFPLSQLRIDLSAFTIQRESNKSQSSKLCNSILLFVTYRFTLKGGIKGNLHVRVTVSSKTCIPKLSKIKTKLYAIPRNFQAAGMEGLQDGLTE
jgi:hypothetical protein